MLQYPTSQNKEKPQGIVADIKGILHDSVYINWVPSYGNTIFYSFGFLLMTCFLVLLVSGLFMVLGGESWWLTNQIGVYTRSVHMWAAQAFMLFLVLHLFVVFSTSAFKKRKLIWVLGSVLLFLFVIQAELGYGIRGDFSAQWRSLGGADFWNGSGLGRFINPLNFSQIFNLHTLIIPLVGFVLIALHYSLVRRWGVSKPYRPDIKYTMVEANHTMLYIRGGIVLVVVLSLALFIQSPFLPAVTSQQIAKKDPGLFAQTLLAEFARTSDTATYSNTVDPYQFDTRSVYVIQPYEKLIATSGGQDLIKIFNGENSQAQKQVFSQAQSYVQGNWDTNNALSDSNPLVAVVAQLTRMARGGLYGPAVQANVRGNNPTYISRFLADTGYIEDTADSLGLGLESYGMLKDEVGNGVRPPNSWWMAPFSLMDNTLLANDPNQDRDGAEVIGLTLLILATFPWIPYANQIPDKIGLYRLFWKRKQKKSVLQEK